MCLWGFGFTSCCRPDTYPRHISAMYAPRIYSLICCATDWRCLTRLRARSASCTPKAPLRHGRSFSYLFAPIISRIFGSHVASARTGASGRANDRGTKIKYRTYLKVIDLTNLIHFCTSSPHPPTCSLLVFSFLSFTHVIVAQVL